MKVIRTKNKLQDVCTDIKIRKKSGDSNDVSNESVFKALSTMKGSTNFIKYQDQPDGAEREEPENAECLEITCRVCGRSNGLQTLDDCSGGEPCDRLVLDCFGVQVNNSSWKICEQCAQLIRSSYKFKEMVCNALYKPFDAELSQSSSLECGSIQRVKLKIPERDANDRFVRRISLKQKPALMKDDSVTKKTFAVCTVCRQKYPMMLSSNHGVFVCSRCKINRSSERTVACVKCRAVLPSGYMKDHLEMHATTDLKGRFRLRSLSKKPSNSQTADCIPKKRGDQQKLSCKYCHRKFPYTISLTEHMKTAHSDYSGRNACVCKICGKDMKDKGFLERHLKTHERSKFFECHVCGKIFKTNLAFKRHREIHQSAKKYLL